MDRGNLFKVSSYPRGNNVSLADDIGTYIGIKRERERERWWGDSEIWQSGVEMIGRGRFCFFSFYMGFALVAGKMGLEKWIG